MQSRTEELYSPALRKFGFVPEPDNHCYVPNGLCWRQAGEGGDGYYWIYGQKDLFTIKIHDFSFREDSFLEFDIPACLSVTYYESISGEELSPYRRLTAGCVKTFLGGMEPYRVLIHKNIPITSIGIDITPAYYETWLKRQYPEEYVHPLKAFRTVDQTDCFPEMVRLLEQVKNYRGEGIAARLFYEAKVAEAVSLVVARGRKQSVQKKELTQEEQRRMSRGEQLLSETDLPIGQIARSVGYRRASRFAELFRESTGLTPGEYRRCARQ